MSHPREVVEILRPSRPRDRQGGMEDVRALLEALRPHLHRHPGAIVLGNVLGGRVHSALYTTLEGIKEDREVDVEVEYLLSDGRSVRGFS